MPTTIEDRLVVGDVSVVPDLYRQHGAFIHTISQELVGAAADRLTQQVFAEAWRDRLNFDPSLGTVRNWLVRRARARVSKASPEAEGAVDRLVVADSLHRMEELRRQVVLAGLDESDADSLARRLDQPVATIRANLRRGTDQLKADLAESRLDGDDAGLIDIMTEGPPSLQLVTPPEVVWQAIAAELNLDTGAVTTDDFNRIDEPMPVEEVDSTDAGTSDVDSAAETEEVEEVEEVEDVVAPLDEDDRVEADDKQVDGESVQAAGEPAEQSDADRSVDHLRELAEEADVDRPSWIAPTVVALALVIVIVLILATL